MTILVRLVVDAVVANPNHPNTRLEVRDERGELVEGVGQNGSDFNRGRQHSIHEGNSITLRLVHDSAISPAPPPSATFAAWWLAETGSEPDWSDVACIRASAAWHMALQV